MKHMCVCRFHNKTHESFVLKFSCKMVLTKQFLRYEASAQFGIVASQRANVTFLKIRNTDSRYVAVGACENVNVWDTRTQEKVLVLQGDKCEVTALGSSTKGDQLAVGYTDGSVQVFNVITGESNVTFTGHRSPISCLAFDKDGMKLASGSHDTEIVIWDLVNESGLYRLKGHKGIVTHLHFLVKRNMLISSSKDTFVKWWDLDTQHCFKTMTSHRAEVWTFVIAQDESRLITGSADSELRVWSLEFLGQQESTAPPPAKQNKPFEEVADTDNLSIDDMALEDIEMVEDRQVVCNKMGSIMRRGKDRVVTLALTKDGKHLACHGNDKTVELFYLYSEDEIEVRLKKKLKRIKKKQKDDGENVDTEIFVERSVDDEISPAGICACAGKVCSLDICDTKTPREISVVTLLRNNQIESVTARTKVTTTDYSNRKCLSLLGHRTECKSICFTSDGLALLSAASQSAKLWNRSSNQCVRTLQCVHAQCCVFVPGDRQVLIGTQSGSIEVHDVASGSHLETISAHEGSITSLCLTADRSGVVSGGEDKTLKLWEFDLVPDEKRPGTNRLTLTHTRTLELDDQVLSIDVSSNKRHVAVALLDCTVTIFYVDSLKFFLSLYGHSLPVRSLSISTDSSLIVTGSTDRNVKIWGMDFGDCHRSLFAHDDDVMAVKFVPDTHLFFSCGKDGLIKQWDADKFLLIQVLKGHIGAVMTLAVSGDGDFIASSGKDRSLRFWQRSHEVVIPSEEREKEREEEEEKVLPKSQEAQIPGEAANDEVGMASKTTIESVKGAERIMEAIELHRDELVKEMEHKSVQKKGEEVPYQPQHPILKAYGNIPSDRYVLQTLRKIKSSELEESLLVMPFSYVPDLLTLLNTFVTRGREVELVCRVMFFLLRVHHGRITSNQMLVEVLDDLRRNTQVKVDQLKDRIGFNIAALGHMRRQIEARNDVTFFSDATQQRKEKSKKKRKREKLQRAVIAV
uniref:WD repeat-containing protein 3 n=1 Tax=Phallusia mammillata TaxID=59560 RepID=A0A6F9D8C5_9ASCI|nr:WD repeat-containing protein 3 [Phallusia mammillata]